MLRWHKKYRKYLKFEKEIYNELFYPSSENVIYFLFYFSILVKRPRLALKYFIIFNKMNDLSTNDFLLPTFSDKFYIIIGIIMALSSTFNIYLVWPLIQKIIDLSFPLMQKAAIIIYSTTPLAINRFHSAIFLQWKHSLS